MRYACTRAWPRQRQADLARHVAQARADDRLAGGGSGHERRVLRLRRARRPVPASGSPRRSRALQEEWLHLFNLPAGTDVRRLREQVSRVERELEALTLALADRESGDGGSGPRPRRSRSHARVRSASPPIRRVAPCLRPRATSAAPDSTASSSARSCGPGTGSGSSPATTGPKVGASPKDVVWRRGRARALALSRRRRPLRAADPDRLQPRQPQLHPRPARRATAPSSSSSSRGFDVFMLDWGVPDERDAENSLETYVDGYLPRAVEAVRRETRLRRDHARRLLPRRDDRDPLRERARRRARAQPRAPRRPDRLRARWARWWPACSTGGSRSRTWSTRRATIPAGTVYGGFFMQAPTVEVARHATLLDNLWNDEYVDGWQAMAQWSRDHVPFPGAAARQIIDVVRPPERADERERAARRAGGQARATPAATS